MTEKNDESLTFTPAPHANAEVHAKIMADLRKMTPEQILQTAKDAGIYDENGKLTQAYKSNR